MDLGSSRHSHGEEESSPEGPDGAAQLSTALSEVLRLVGLDEAELPALVQRMVPEISELASLQSRAHSPSQAGMD